MEDFEKARWKLVEDMDAHDIELIMANKDKLNDEEKAAFANLIQENTPLTDDPLGNAIDNAVDDPEVVTPPVENKPAVTPDPVVPAVPAQPVIQQAELDTYLEGKRKEWEAQGKTAAEQKQQAEEIKEIFDKGFTPNDWNDFSVKYLEKIAPIIEKRVMDTLAQQNAERTKAQDEMKQTAQKIYEGFEGEFKDLASKGSIPAVGTPEYKEVHDSIIAVGDKYGRKNIMEAFELWSLIPKDKGGGLDYTPQTPADPNAKIKAQKEAAGRIGSARGSATPAKKGNDWASIHNTPLDELVERRLQQS